MTNYTRQQSIALSLDRNMCVTANAGSGKTTVLVDKFLNIILDESLKADPKKVVAITFTKKAASEMLTKIVNKLEGEIFAESDFTKLKKLRQVRELLTYARISTIHSFCSSILRDFPIEANVSPFFYEISNSEKRTIRQNSMLSIFEAWLESPDDGKKLRAKNLFRELGRKKVQDIVESLLNKRELAENFEKLYMNSNEEILRPVYEILCIKVNESGKLMLELAEAVDRLYIDLSKTKDSNEGFFLDKIVTKLTVDELINTDKLKSHLIALKVNSKLLFNNDGNMNKNFLKKKKLTEEEVFILTSYNVRISELSKLLNEINDFGLDHKTIDLTRTLLEITYDIDELIEKEKQEINGLDFDDLLIKTRELLKNQYILGKVRRNIDYLLVDEFQDTNFIQYDIIKNIIMELADERIYPNSTQLFIVGDAKQSIYGFRNSDVRVFNQAMRDIKKINNMKLDQGLLNNEFPFKNQKIIALNKDESLGDIKLTATFRLQPVIASFVDIVCSNLMKSSLNEYDINYEPFLCARNVDSLIQKEKPEENFAGSVSFLISRKNEKQDNGNEDEEEYIGEAENISKFILNSLYGDNPLQVMDDKGKMRNVSFKDIAVLSRKRLGFTSLAEAFLINNIPFVVHSGRGFFQTQEILDIISFLNFINTPEDDISLAALLRSPFFNVDDITLLNISKEEGASLWEKMNNNINTLSQNKTNTTRAFVILEKYIKIADRIPIYKLLGKFLQDTAWFGTVTNKPGEKQIIANIEKFLNFARDYDSRGFKNIYDFINEVNFISENDVDESESVFITDDDVINVMTIHASKGLEFPVVIIQGTNSKAKQGGGFVVSPELGIWYPVQKMNDKNALEQVEPAAYIITKEEWKKVDIAEQKRVLYVALTRAKDRLVISAEVKIKKEKPAGSPAGFFKMIIESLDTNLDEILANDVMNLENKLKILIDNKQIDINHKFNFDVINNIEEVAEIKNMEEKAVAERVLNLKEISSKIENLNYSPTRIQSFFDDELNYRKKYLLGLTLDLDNNRFFFQDDDIDEESGIIFGTLMHKILENINSWLKSDLEINEDELKRTIHSVIPFNLLKNKELSDNLLNESRMVAKTKLIRDNYHNIIDSRAEYSLIMPLNDDFLNSKIDLLLKNDKGIYEVWDWKTNLIKNPFDKDKLIAHYEFQMKIYTLLVSKIYKQDCYIARILFTKLADEKANDDEWTHNYIWTLEELAAFESDLKEKINSIPRI